MQYAEVIPDSKTDLLRQSFTYKILPDQLLKLRTGSLVLIPFGKRKIEGIIVKIVRFSPKNIRSKLKPILKILSSKPVVDEPLLNLSNWMSSYYYAPLSKCLFEMIPIPPKRKHSLIVTPSSRPKFPNPYPLSSILNLCKRIIAHKKQILIIFPEVNQAEVFSASLSKHFKKVALYHGELNHGKRYQLWSAIKQNNYDIICGSRTAIFSPLDKLGLVIFFDEESEAYKNERSPHYNAKTIALKLIEYRSAKLVFLSATPSIESYYYFGKKLNKQKKQNIFLIRPKPLKAPDTLNIVDMKKEISRRNFGPLSNAVKIEMQNNYKKGGKTILFVNRRGAASYIFCRDCGYIFACPSCNLPLTYHLPSRDHKNTTPILICHHCAYKASPQNLCPSCQGMNLKFGGTGTQRVESEIKKLFIKPRIARIDQDYTDSDNQKPDFIIGTQKIFSAWHKPADLVIVVSSDSLLNIPDLYQSEKVYSTISKLKSLARKKFIIQTFHPNNFVIRAALEGNWQYFFKSELASRKKLDLPPFSKLIKIIYGNRSNERCQTKIEFIADKIQSIINKNSLNITLLGPTPCFYNKIRGKYRWQIVLKIMSRALLNPILTHLIKNLPPDWIIDVDPVTIL